MSIACTGLIHPLLRTHLTTITYELMYAHAHLCTKYMHVWVHLLSALFLINYIHIYIYILCVHSIAIFIVITVFRNGT